MVVRYRLLFRGPAWRVGSTGGPSCCAWSAFPEADEVGTGLLAWEGSSAEVEAPDSGPASCRAITPAPVAPTNSKAAAAIFNLVMNIVLKS